VESVNKRQKSVLFEKIKRHFNGQLANKTIGVWGLAFKPNTDDMREAPSRYLMEALWNAGARVRAYDPVAHEEATRLYGEREELTVVKSAMDATHGADALAILTEWQEFRSPDFETLKTNLRQAVIFDGRNLYDPSFVKRFGLKYYAIGRGDSIAARSS
jgi:UDPglucose 6-dehydrogenase